MQSRDNVSPDQLIDEIMIRLELIERNASEMARSERSEGKMIAILTMTEEVRDRLRELKALCKGSKGP